jgi:hypothetical protein
MRVFGIVAASALLALAACASKTTDDSATGGSDLSTTDFNAAASKLGSLPYLPWKYTTDGCYARALYYSMTLAEQGIPTKHVYVDAKADAPALFGIWGWHVAPIATKDGENQLYVFDPALFPDRVVTVKEWVAIQGYADPTAANYPDLSIADGTSYNTNVGSTPLPDAEHPSAQLYGEPTFAAMPKFDIGSINAACDVMHSYIELEPNQTDASRFTKHQGLRDATIRLIGSLTAKDKMDGTIAQLDPSCTVPEQLDTTTCGADLVDTKPARAACCVASKHWCWSNKANNGAGDCVAEGTVEGDAVCSANQWQAKH